MTAVWQTVFCMLIYIISMMLIQHLTRKRLFITTGFFVMTIFSFPLWTLNLDGWFRWLKTMSLLIPVNYLNLVRISYKTESQLICFLRQKWVFATLWFILALNIAEGIIKDASTGHYMNALAALILIITIPLPRKNNWHVSKDNDQVDVLLNLPYSWIILYTTWNACVVYAENPGYVASSICILLAPLLYSVVTKRPDYYVSGRIYTVALHVFIRAAFGNVFAVFMDSSSWANTKVIQIWGTINGILLLIYIVCWIHKKLQSKPAISAT